VTLYLNGNELVTLLCAATISTSWLRAFSMPKAFLRLLVILRSWK